MIQHSGWCHNSKNMMSMMSMRRKRTRDKNESQKMEEKSPVWAQHGVHEAADCGLLQALVHAAMLTHPLMFGPTNGRFTQHRCIQQKVHQLKQWHHPPLACMQSLCLSHSITNTYVGISFAYWSANLQ